MSASEGAGGVVTPSRDSLTVAGLQNSPALAPAPPQPQPVAQPVSLPYSTDAGVAVYSPATASSQPFQASSTASGTIEGSSGAGVVFQQQKKRGRPRKYGNMAMTPSGSTFSPPAAVNPPPSGGTFSPSPAVPAQALPPSQAVPLNSGGLTSAPPAKKGRGRPPGSGSGSGSGRKQHRQHQQHQHQDQQEQMDALGSAGYGFTPHIITVNAGEDLSSKIMSFSQHGPRDICIMSANGSISNVTLRQAAISGGTATYEGRFEILSLSGSFLLTEVGGQRTRTGGLSVALIGPDGRVLGGSVAGLLTAASAVKVLVGSFIANGRKESKPVNNMDPLSAPLRVNAGGALGANSPPSHGTLSESSGGPGSPLNLGTASCSNNGLGMSSIPWK